MQIRPSIPASLAHGLLKDINKGEMEEGNTQRARQMSIQRQKRLLIAMNPHQLCTTQVDSKHKLMSQVPSYPCSHFTVN